MRPGMSSIISTLRSYTQTVDTAEDNLLNDVFDDDYLQAVLDTYATDTYEAELIPLRKMSGSSYVYTRYYLPSTTPAYLELPLVITDHLGETVDPSKYTYTEGMRFVEFTSDTQGYARFVTVRGYDMRYAAARVWYEKAARRVSLVNWKANGLSISEDQEYTHCMDMYNRFLGGDDVAVLFNGITAPMTRTLKKGGYVYGDSKDGYATINEITSGTTPFA